MPVTDGIIGIDLGGTKCGIALYANPAALTARYTEFPTRAERGFQAVFDELVTALRPLVSEAVAVGIGVPGAIGPQGAIHTLPNIPGAENFELNRELQLATGKPVFSGNDAQFYVLAESAYGFGRHHEVVVGVTLGTGVGGGITINGRLFRGNHGTAGEFGHMLFGTPLGTPAREHEVEARVSGTALKRRGIESTSAEYLHDLADLLASIHYAYNPGMIVLGGSVAKSIRKELPRLRHLLLERVLIPRLCPSVEVSELEHPGCRGAAHFAMQQLAQA